MANLRLRGEFVIFAGVSVLLGCPVLFDARRVGTCARAVTCEASHHSPRVQTQLVFRTEQRSSGPWLRCVPLKRLAFPAGTRPLSREGWATNHNPPAHCGKLIESGPQAPPIADGEAAEGAKEEELTYPAATISALAAASSRKRSASSAAMQPMPAAVTAWRYSSSVTSPAAKTPGTFVAVESGSVMM